MAFHGIEYEDSRIAYPWESPQAKQRLVDSGESLAGTLPVVSVAGQHFCGHLPIMRYLEGKVRCHRPGWQFSF